MLLVGALEGDFHKGPLRGDLPAGLEAGIALHRAIDAFTDAHYSVETIRARFPAPLRRYAGILIDLSFDHFLTRNWTQYSDVPLAHFNAKIYSLLQQHSALLSPKAKRLALRLQQYDVLGLYHRWEAVPDSAARIGERFRRGNPLRNTHDQLLPLVTDLQQAFDDFYPDLIQFSTLRRQPGPDS